ncbi:MAG: exodeoxyribonuclease V subunit beta [Casimicrobiaceae bacterium]
MPPLPLDLLACPLEGATLVEASAGTGKTWNICGLYLRLLLEREFDVREILVVTFTNAATAELRTRIRDRIVETLRYARDGVADPHDDFVHRLVTQVESVAGRTRDDTVARLSLALHSLDDAAILTIHGFASRALADTPFASGLPFAVELLTDDSAILQDVVNDFWRREVASDDCDPALAAFLIDRRDSPESFARIVARRMAKPFARLRFPDGVDAAPANTTALADCYRAATALWHAQRAAIAEIFAQRREGALHRNVYHADSIARAFLDWDHWLRAGDPLAPYPKDDKLDLLTSARLLKCTSKGSTTPAHPFFAAAGALRDTRRALQNDLARARLALIRRLVEHAPAEVRKRKRDARVAGYDDLLHNLHAALESHAHPGLPDRLRAQYPAALIDEFQDTDPLQFAIFEAIYRGSDAPVFLVGDPKQSIYGFRNADLHAYFAAGARARAHFTLLENQRATPALIAAQNALFGANARAFALYELDYRAVTAGTRHRALLTDDSAPRAPLTVWMLPPAADGAPMLRADAKAAAVRATAAEIARLLRESAQERICLDDVPLRSADIAVLVRTHAQGVDVKDALAALGVGSVELAQESIFRTPDADEVARVLAAVLEPSRANLVRSALATQILGQGAAAIAALTDDDAAFAAHVDRFVEYRALWRTRGFAVMYRRLIAGEGVVARMLARSDGERRMTNLLHLGEQLQEAAASGMAPDALLRWLATERNERARDDARELRLESDRNLVHIVTIHKAKGLEYPFVFCPFFFEGGYWQPRTDVREYHDDGDAVLDFTPADKGNPESVAIDARILAEVAAERLRLLYVALTRAAQRCYLVAGVYAMVQGRSTKESARALGNWLVAGDGMDLVAWLANGRSPDDIAADWRRLAERAARDIAIVPLPLDRGTPFVEAATDPAAIVARTPPARIRAEWRIGSFSALAQGATSDGAAADHDARAVEPDATAAASSAQADDIVRFPRGAAAGECLHAIFERIDFGDSGGWPTIVADALAQFPPARTAADGARLAPMVERMLRDVVATPLPMGGTLATVTRERRLVELGFTFPASTPDTARLRDAVAAAGYATPRLAPGRLHGYLNGYVDLVFEHAGRYYVLDWKSNHLGNTAADYASAALARTMRDHGYHLQQLIYAVALDRYLRRRIPRYDHDTHFGGVLYLFVRGVRPDWRAAGGAQTGVYFDRPSAATLARIADALRVPAVESA